MGTRVQGDMAAPRTHEADPLGPDRTPVALSDQDGHGPHPFKGRCEQHGIHTAVDAASEELLVEANATEWTPRSQYTVSYCEGCAQDPDERSLDDPLPAEESDAETARRLLDNHWSDVRAAFEPAFLEAAGEIEYCPFCGEELVRSSRPHGDTEASIACETHGRITLAVRQLEEAFLHA